MNIHTQNTSSGNLRVGIEGIDPVSTNRRFLALLKRKPAFSNTSAFPSNAYNNCAPSILRVIRHQRDGVAVYPHDDGQWQGTHGWFLMDRCTYTSEIRFRLYTTQKHGKGQWNDNTIYDYLRPTWRTCNFRFELVRYSLRAKCYFQLVARSSASHGDHNRRERSTDSFIWVDGLSCLPVIGDDSAISTAENPFREYIPNQNHREPQNSRPTVTR